MQYTVYKPNPKKSGALANFRVSKTKNEKRGMWEERVFIEFLPQKSWNEEKSTGSFDPEKRRTVMINPTEGGEFVNTLLNGQRYETYHKSGDTGTYIKIGPFQGKRKFKDKNGEEVTEAITRFGLAISGKGFNISLPIDPGEAQCLRVFFENYVKGALGLEGSEQEKKFKSKKDNSSDDSSSEVEDDEDPDVEDEEDDDIPF